MTTSAERVAGWDLLRGLCALTVASYHLLYWMHIVELPALGTYGVYLFFVLSGASLAYNYPAASFAGAGDYLRFLRLRWLRLAPLYIALCFVFLAMLWARSGGGGRVDGIPMRLAMNATFLFGLDDPAVGALLIGGWSLGIEFVYYLFFPALVFLLPRSKWALSVWAALTIVQWYWIESTIGARGWAASVAYHQVPAFAAYFMGGCVIGHVRRAARGDWAFVWGVLAWAVMAALLFLLMPQEPGDELIGIRGVTLFTACFAVVFVSGNIEVGGSLRKLSAWMGDITYGTYLLHPILFWTIAWFVLPDVAELPLALRVPLLLAVLASATALAYCSERWFERPLRRLGRGRKPRYIEAASISS